MLLRGKSNVATFMQLNKTKLKEQKLSVTKKLVAYKLIRVPFLGEVQLWIAARQSAAGPP